MNKPKPAAGEFRGMLDGVEYTDRAEFEKAARDAGWRSGMSNRTGDVRVGHPVSVRLRAKTEIPHRTPPLGDPVLGQVWAKGPEPRCGYVWLALDNGKYAKLWTSSGEVQEVDALGVRTGRIGKVAA